MNHWARMLAELPALGQRQIARSQRISLPRRCDAATRLARLRQALCHAATVREVYAGLAPATQQALQQLRACRGGLRSDALDQRFGPIRSWRQIAADPIPRSIAEELLLLGWLLPRAATPRHPPHYLVPPEVRRWLPHPLEPPASTALASCAEPPPAARAAATLLLACAERPLALTRAGTLRRAELRLLLPRLADIPTDPTNLIAWLLPLLVELDLLDTHDQRASITVAGQRFLALSPAEQRARLQAAWLCSPTPDAWLLRERVDPRGIDWPLLRRRLCAWARVVPPDDPRDAATRYAELARSFGPLADAQTHGFRSVERAPWQPRRAAAVLDAALRGPLAWLGLTGAADVPGEPAPVHHAARVPDHPYRMRRSPRRAGGRPRRASTWSWPEQPADAEPPKRVRPDRSSTQARWRYAEPGVIVVPHEAAQAATLRLLPFACWDGADATATRYRITRSTLARALGQGWSASTCWQLLEQQAGVLPDRWRPDTRSGDAPLRLLWSAVLLADTPEVLARAATARSVRRSLHTRLAPGIALVRAEHIASLTRALARQAVACAVEAPASVPMRQHSHSYSKRTQTNADEHARSLSNHLPGSSQRSDSSAIRCESQTSGKVRKRYLNGSGSELLPAREADADLSAGERAALAIACAHYRQHAPATAPLLPHAGLEARLRAGLSPRLNAAVDAALAELRPPPVPAAIPADAPAPLQRTIEMLRDALARQRPVELIYDTAGQGAPNARTVRPLAIDQRGGSWYLRAYCNARQAERTFRIDRIFAIG